MVAHYYSQPAYRMKIDRRHYFPSPKVHGALATFELTPENERSLVGHERLFLATVRQAFGSKRKMLGNSLQPTWQRNEVEAALSALGESIQVLCPTVFLIHGDIKWILCPGNASAILLNFEVGPAFQ